MKMIKRWQLLSLTINPKKAGYSDMRLWPAQLLFYHLIILVAVTTNIWIAIPLVTIPSLLLAIAINDFQEKACSYMYFDLYAYWEAAELNREKGIEIDFDYHDFQDYSTPSMTRHEYFDRVLAKVGIKRVKQESLEADFTGQHISQLS